MGMDTILFDREEANLRAKQTLKRYEDVFNCRVLMFGVLNEETKNSKTKFLNMDYPILFENMKRQLINKKVKFDRQQLKLSKQQSVQITGALSSPQHSSSSSGVRKRSFLKQASSPLSALEHAIKEETIDDLSNERRNKVISHDTSIYYDQSAIDSGSSDSFVLDDDDEGEDIHYFTAARSHRLSLNHSEEMIRNDSSEDNTQNPFNHSHHKQMSQQIGNFQYYDVKSYEEIFSIQFDFQNFLSAKDYKSYKSNICKSSICNHKQSKILADNSSNFDKRCLLQSSFDNLSIDYSKYPLLETQGLTLNILEVDKTQLLNSSSLSSIQKLQINQADVFVFELRDCSMVLDNPYMGFEQKSDLEEILQELEQLIPTIYENMDPTSQNLETPFIFSCHSCNDHKDNDHTIEHGAIKQLNPKILKFFKDLGINYQTNFFPTCLKDSHRHGSTSGVDSSSESTKKERSSSINNNLQSKLSDNLSYSTATVNHDTGRLMVTSLEETTYQICRKVFINKLDMYYQVEKKNGRLVSSSTNESSSLANQSTSSFSVSKDVRALSNGAPPIQSPVFTNRVIFNTGASTRQDTDQLITPTTENYTIHSQSTDANLTYFNSQQRLRSNNSSPVMYRSALRSEATTATKANTGSSSSTSPISDLINPARTSILGSENNTESNEDDLVRNGFSANEILLSPSNILSEVKSIEDNTKTDVYNQDVNSIAPEAPEIEYIRKKGSNGSSDNKKPTSIVSKQVRTPAEQKQRQKEGACCVVM